MEECQMLRSREAIQLRAIAIRFLMSCSLDPVLWILTPRTVAAQIYKTNILCASEPVNQ